MSYAEYKSNLLDTITVNALHAMHAEYNHVEKGI